VAFWKTVTTPELKVGGRVLLKEQEWEIVALSGQGTTVRRNGIERVGRQNEWKYKGPDIDAPEVFPAPQTALDPSSDLVTVQEYLRAIGFSEDHLEINAKTFGTVVMRLYRERHGKTARPAKKLEYVRYLDINGMEAQRPNDEAPRHLRVRPNGWYESNAFEAGDVDLLDQVAKVRHPGYPTLAEATARALATVTEMVPEAAEAYVATSNSGGDVGLVWLAEKAVQQCLSSGVICGHGECARRRAKQSKRINAADLEDWS
jgi:hypothetical protein